MAWISAACVREKSPSNETSESTKCKCCPVEPLAKNLIVVLIVCLIIYVYEARFRRRSTHVPNLIDELSPAKERRLNQFGTAVLIRCGNVVKFDKVCRIIRHWSGNWFIRRSSHVPNQMH